MQHSNRLICVNAQGTVNTYRNVDRVWTFVVEDAAVSIGMETHDIGVLKIVVYDTKEGKKNNKL